MFPLATKMQYSTLPHLLSLAHHGYIQGSTISDSEKLLCYFYGGIRYASPPSERWQKATPLRAGFTYGTKEAPAPGLFPTGAKICPQPGFLEIPDQSNWDEDCFQCNVWVPTGEPPAGGKSRFLPIPISYEGLFPIL
jgi:carboxylesterase type B